MEVNAQYASGYDTGYRSASRKKTAASFRTSLKMNEAENTVVQSIAGSVHTKAATGEELYSRKPTALGTEQFLQAEKQSDQMQNLGTGFLFVKDIGMGMSASQIINKASGDVIVRVKAAKSENCSETFDVNLSKVDPRNASAIEMFVFCQYADENGTGVDNKWGSWYALKQFSTSFGERLEYSSLEDAANQKRDWTKALSESEYLLTIGSTGETLSAADVFKMLKETIIEEHTLTPDNIKKEDDWREMDDEQWNKLIEHIDQYIDDIKEKLERMKELREEAAMKAIADAPANMRAAAISKAMLYAVANGTAGGEQDQEVSHLEKISWTYNMQTDDQIILATAKMANEFAADMISKSQELALMGDTSVGISETENMKECAYLEEDERR